MTFATEKMPRQHILAPEQARWASRPKNVIFSTNNNQYFES